MKSSPSMRDPIAIIAGNGRLPLEIAEFLKKQDIPYLIVALNDEADPEVESHTHEWWSWEKVGRLFKILTAHGIKKIVLAGGVVGRPEFKFSKMDFGALRTLPGVLATLLSGDNAVLTGVITVFEKRGFEVCSVANVMPELTIEPGANTPINPNSADLERITEGFAVTRALGEFDIGQGCVVIGKRAVAIEGAEGTDSMLKRVTALRENGRLPRKRGGVLVKAMKSGQDERADLPAIGPDTIQAVHDAGLVGIGVQAGKTLVISKQETLDLARQLKVFIYGFEPNHLKHDHP